MSLAISGWGSYLSSSPDGASYTQRAEIMKIDQSDVEIKILNLTHLLSPSNAMEKGGGIMDPGHLTLEYNFTKGEYATMATFAASRTLYYWKITLATGSTFVCLGFVQKLGSAIPFDDKMTSSCTIELTGIPVFTA